MLNILKYIGGKNHVFCEKYKLPFITCDSNNVSKCCGIINNCNCCKKIFLSCPNLCCPNGICKNCFDNLDDSEIHFVSYKSIDNNCNSTQDSDHMSDDDDFEEELSRRKFLREQSSFLQQEEIRYQKHQEYLENINNETMDDPHNIYECDNMDENEFFQNENNNTQYLSNHAPSFFPIEDDTPDDVIPTTDSSEQALFIENETSNNNPLVHGHVILNQACTLLSRHDKQIRSYKNQKKFIQRIASTNTGSSIPLLYPEAMLFPSKFWFLDVQSCSFVGALPVGLLCHAHSFCGFEKPLGHIRTRTTSIISNTSSNSQYVPFCWDIMANLSLNRQDSRII